MATVVAMATAMPRTLNLFDNKCNGKYDQQLQRLIIGYQDKVRKEEEGKNVTNNFNNPSFGAMYDVHNNENVHT